MDPAVKTLLEYFEFLQKHGYVELQVKSQK